MDSAEGSEQYKTMDTEKNTENVTVRQRNKCNLSANESVLDISYQSLPSPNILENQEVLDLKMELERLTLELNIAHNEIENLNSENSSLKNKIKDCDHLIRLYKTVSHLPDQSISCSTPLKFYSPQYRKIISKSAKIGVRRTSPTQLQAMTKFNMSASTIPISTKKNGNIEYKSCENFKPDVASIVDYAKDYGTGCAVQEKLSDPISSPEKIKVMLFADERGRRMRSILQHLVGQNYTVCSFVKPNGNMKQVLDSAISQCQDLTKSDFVIILAGSHDNEINSLQSILHETLCQLQHTNVIVGNVCRNSHLNEYRLNNVINELCCKLKNVSYIDLNDYDSHDPSLFHRLYSSRLLLRLMLKIEYYNRFETYMYHKNEKLNIKLNGQSTSKCYTSTCTQTYPILNTSPSVGSTNNNSINGSSFFRVASA